MVFIIRIKNGKKEIEDFKGFPLPDPREDKTIVLITVNEERAKNFQCLPPEQEIIRLREQEERVTEKLNKNPQIMELLDELRAEDILKRLTTTN